MSLCLADPTCPLLLRKLLRGHKFQELFHAAGGRGPEASSEGRAGQNGFPSKRGPALQHKFGFSVPALPGASALGHQGCAACLLIVSVSLIKHAQLKIT